MDWSAQVDLYCERSGPEFWAEPVNAITNGAFLIAAAVMGWRLRGACGAGLAWAMVAVLAAIGVGSFLFHTHATVWAGIADVLPILAFVLIYVFAAARDMLGWRALWAGLAVLAFLPLAAALGTGFRALPFFAISAGYWPIVVVILGVATALRRRTPATARGLAAGAAILSLSLMFRSLDQALCDVLPLGTHFLWHLLNALMLGWMIEVYRRHLCAPAPAVAAPQVSR